MTNPKILTMYLPQFHRVPENDLWWGEGFTDWESAKLARPLFDNHYQPRVPLNKNYYNLLEKSTMEFQASLMKNYHVYGMCFYHYYFEKGKRILEKPAENLLKWSDIDMPFCFSWANESWARTWSNIRNKNTWNLLADNICIENKDDKDNGVLLRQVYGEVEEWRSHFYYLLPFFRDGRYIRINNKPMFIIYKTNDISCLDEMVKCWNEMARKEGLDGVYFISTYSINDVCDATLLQEPQYSMRYCRGGKSIDSVKALIDYDEVCKISANLKFNKENIIYLSASPGYDDTPRRGADGTVLYNSSPQKFEKYLRTVIKNSQARNNEFVFVNAWNEWGEGMYLEPDEKYGYGYLEAVKNAIEHPDGDLIPYDYTNVVQSVDEFAINSAFDRANGFWRVLDKWLTVRERGESISAYLINNGYDKIAIYGLGMLGQHLISDCKENKLCISYGIDKKWKTMKFDFPVKGIEDTLPRVKIIIVTVMYDFLSIKRELKNRISCEIVSVEEVLDKIL